MLFILQLNRIIKWHSINLPQRLQIILFNTSTISPLEILRRQPELAEIIKELCDCPSPTGEANSTAVIQTTPWGTHTLINKHITLHSSQGSLFRSKLNPTT